MFYHSVNGVGKMKPDPNGNVDLYDDVIVSTGKVLDNPESKGFDNNVDLQYNEYVIYDVS